MKAVRNTLYLYISLVLTTFLGFVQLKILTHFLSKRDMGLFFAASGICLVITTLIQFGFPNVFARYIPKYYAEGQPRKTGSLVALSLLLYSIFGVAIYLILLGLRLFIRGKELIDLLCLAFPAYFFYSLFALLLSVFIGERRMHLTAIFNVGYMALVNVLLFFLRNFLNLPLVFYIIFSASLIFTLISLLEIDLQFRGIQNIRREIQPFWSYSFLNSLLAPLFVHIDRILIPAFLPYTSLAVFGVARKIEQSLRRFFGIPLNAIAPEVSFHYENRKELSDRFKTTICVFTKAYYIAVVFIIGVVILVGKPLILLVSSEKYLEAFKYLVIILIGSSFAGIYAPFTMVARSLGRMDLFFLSDLVWLSVFILIFLPLVKLLGLAGAALSFCLAYLATFVFVISAVIPKVLKIRFAEFGLLAGIFAETGTLLLNYLLGRKNLTSIQVGTILLSLLLGFLLFKKEELQILTQFIRQHLTQRRSSRNHHNSERSSS